MALSFRQVSPLRPSIRRLAVSFLLVKAVEEGVGQRYSEPTAQETSSETWSNQAPDIGIIKRDYPPQEPFICDHAWEVDALAALISRSSLWLHPAGTCYDAFGRLRTSSAKSRRKYPQQPLMVYISLWEGLAAVAAGLTLSVQPYQAGLIPTARQTDQTLNWSRSLRCG